MCWSVVAHHESQASHLPGAETGVGVARALAGQKSAVYVAMMRGSCGICVRSFDAAVGILATAALQREGMRVSSYTTWPSRYLMGGRTAAEQFCEDLQGKEFGCTE